MKCSILYNATHDRFHSSVALSWLFIKTGRKRYIISKTHATTNLKKGWEAAVDVLRFEINLFEITPTEEIVKTLFWKFTNKAVLTKARFKSKVIVQGR